MCVQKASDPGLMSPGRKERYGDLNGLVLRIQKRTVGACAGNHGITDELSVWVLGVGNGDGIGRKCAAHDVIEIYLNFHQNGASLDFRASRSVPRVFNGDHVQRSRDAEV